MSTPTVELLESIRLSDGKCPLLDYHQERVDRSRKLLYPKLPQLKLQQLIEAMDLPERGIHKIRIQYGKEVGNVSIQPYEIKVPKKIRLIDSHQLNYAKKYANRSEIEACFERRGDCDDILIIKHGFVTDTSYANVVFYDGVKWFTPSAPLLRGTRRAKLLREGTIKSAIIREKDIPLFKSVRLINGMLPWSEAPVLPIGELYR